MAEFVISIGQVRGKFGNVVAYVRANGKNYCKGESISRKPSTELQKQRAAAFAVVWFIGFPFLQLPAMWICGYPYYSGFQFFCHGLGG